jgi:phosphoserine phosphatase RsbU/P
LEECERERHLIQLQINSLLTITQAINSNVKAPDLFKMYQSFLSWEMNIKKMALFFREDEKWVVVASVGVSPDDLGVENSIEDEFLNMRKMTRIEPDSHAFLQNFELVIPVLHKNEPIAFTFIGGFSEKDEIYPKVQFITTITNMVAVAIENKRLAKQKSREELLNRELQLATEIQQTLVPSILPSGEKYQLSSIYKPHLGIGGDYFDVIEFPDNKFVFCIADVSGKGVGAAILMANFQANLHSLIHRFKGANGENLDLAALMKSLNAAVFRVTKGEKYLTLFIAEFCLETRNLNYINAGHVPPILLEKNKKIRQLDLGTTVIGAFDELPFLEHGIEQVAGEALIFNFTDGLTDVLNENGDTFSEEILNSFVRENADLTVKDFNKKLLDVVENFRGKQPLPDDITVLTCKVGK